MGPGPIPKKGCESPGRSLDHPNLGLTFSPIPNAKKYVFFLNFRGKILNLVKPTWSQMYQLKKAIKTDYGKHIKVDY